MNVPCSMCLENPASPEHRCKDDGSKKCNCCIECSQACEDDWHDAINESEANEMLEY